MGLTSRRRLRTLTFNNWDAGGNQKTMKITLTSLFAIIASVLCTQRVEASLTIADWAFPASGTVTSPINASSSADTTGTPTLSGTLFGNFTSTATQSYGTSGTANVLQFNYSGSHVGDINGQTLTLTLTASTTLNLGSLIYSSSFNNATASHPLTETWIYTITGGTGSSGTWGSATLNNSSLTGESLGNVNGVTLTAGQQLVLTETISGGNNNNGTLDFGEISLTATPVPEPITYALPVFGLIFIGGTAGRLYLRHKRSV